MATKAWIDEEDEVIEARQPEFLKQSHVTPAWAKTAGTASAGPTTTATGVADALGVDGAVGDDQVVRTAAATRPNKRPRNVELDDALASTVPVLESEHQRTTAVKPSFMSVFPLPRDLAQSISWHPGSQLCVVAGQHTVYVFHSAGKYVETVAKISTGGQVDSLVLTSNGDDAIVAPREGYVPFHINLASQKVTKLNFLDTRENFAFRNDTRRDTRGKEYHFITRIRTRTNDSSQGLVAVSHGNTVMLGSLTSGSVVQKIQESEPVADFSFCGGYEIALGVHDKIRLYDIRKSAKLLNEVIDEGSIGTSALAYASRYFAVASTSGVVNVYRRGVPASSALVKGLKNLTTRVGMLAFGEGRAGPILAFASKDLKNGVRVAKLPSCHVIPSFPDVSAHHSFVHAIAFAPSEPVLSIGEKGKVTNYVV